MTKTRQPPGCTAMGPKSIWNRAFFALAALALGHLFLPKHIGGQCGSSGGIPTRPPCGLAPLVGAGGWERRAPRAAHPRPRCGGSGGRCCWGCPLASDVALLLKHLSMPRHFGRHCRNPGLIPARPPLSVPKHVGRHCCARGTAPPTRPPKGAPRCRAGGWERQVSGAPHLRPKRIGTGRCCPQKRSLPRHPG